MLGQLTQVNKVKPQGTSYNITTKHANITDRVRIWEKNIIEQINFNKIILLL